MKKEYKLERDLTTNKLREVSGRRIRSRRMEIVISFSDVFGSIYRADEINNLSDELMAELGRDEKILEKLGSQDLTANEVISFVNLNSYLMLIVGSINCQ